MILQTEDYQVSNCKVIVKEKDQCIKRVSDFFIIFTRFTFCFHYFQLFLLLECIMLEKINIEKKDELVVLRRKGCRLL